MSPLRALIIVFLLAAAGGGGWYFFKPSPPSEPKTVRVERGSIVATVSASGSLTPVVSVQVGSQVSGQLREVLVDFNSEVKKGQLIARIDPETFEYRVRQCEADLDAARAAVLVQEANLLARRADISRAEVNLAEARRDQARKEELVARQFISPAERDKAEAQARALDEELKTVRAQMAVAEAQIKNAQATVKQRQAALAQAQVDLDRTQIRAPVNGVVIKRTIEPGQTVAASLQAPELFVIARNLRDMQVDTAIDEAEIGKIKAGQAASFTVDAFPGRSFSGTVLQVRKAAQNVSNVITYTAVVSAQNDDLSLLPGMTANVRIVAERRESVLKVPNAALRFKPAGWGEGEAMSGAKPGAAGASGADRLKAYRARVDKELAPDNLQKNQLDAAFAALRDRFAALRDLPEGERARVGDRLRGELGERIGPALNAEQKEKLVALNAEWSGQSRRSPRGRIFVRAEDGQLKSLSVRTGISDGSYTEVSAVTEGELTEGDQVVTGAGTPGAAPKSGRPSGGPRMAH